MNYEFWYKNTYRRYPFVDKATLRGNLNGGQIVLRDDIFIDMAITSSEEFLFIKKIHCTTSSIVVEFYNNKTNSPLIAMATIPVVNFEPYSQYELNGTKGHILIGYIDFFFGLNGTIIFNKDALPVLPSIIKKDVCDGITSLADENSGVELKGDIKLLSGYNISITYSAGNNKITFNAIKGEGLGVFCGESCPEPDFCDECLKTINGIGPDNTGTFYFFARNHATIEDDPPGHAITVGTQIPLERIDCIREGDVPPVGPTGPPGPTGPQGEDAGNSTCCYVCDICETCDLCEIVCGICDLCEICDFCENCDIAEN
jgi:hypothetical protein